MTNALISDSIGMDVTDLRGDIDFAQRPPRTRDIAREVEAMQRLAHVFAASPQHILHELTAISMELCGADTVGISLEEPDPAGGEQFRWIALAGAYAPFLGSVLPSRLAPCTICLIRNQPQLVRVSKIYLHAMGVDAPPITDGILIPWQINGTRGTIWAIAHSSSQLFDFEDFHILQDLSDFVAIAVQDQSRREMLTQQTAATAATAMANELAHRINNPLQSLMNTVFLASQGGLDANVYARQATDDLLKLSALVKDFLQQSDSTDPRQIPRRPSSPAASSAARS